MVVSKTYDGAKKTGFFPIRKPEPSELREHKSTNVAACWCFVIYVLLMMAAAVTAFFFGDIKRLTHGVDYQGRLCGVDTSKADVPGKLISDLPYLYYCGSYAFQTGSPSQLNIHARACVEKCPTDNSQQIMCLSRTVVNFSQPVKSPGVSVSNRVDITQVVGQQKSYPTRAHESRLCVPTDPTLKTQLLQGPSGTMHGFGGAIVSLWKGWYVVLVTTLISALLGIAFLACLNHLAGPVILISLIVGALLFLTVGIFFLIGIFFNPDPAPDAYSAYQNLNPIFWTYYGDHARATTFFVGLFFALGAVVLAFVTRNSFPNKIDEVVGVVHVATDCIFSPPLKGAKFSSIELLLFPVFQLITLLIVALILLFGFALILSVGRLEYEGIVMNGQLVKGLEINVAFEGKHNPVKAWFFSLGVKLYAFGMIWIICTIRAIASFSIQHCVCDWFFEESLIKKHDSAHLEIINKALQGQANRVTDVSVVGVDQMRGPRDGFRVKVNDNPFSTQEVVIVPIGKPGPNGKWEIDRATQSTEKPLYLGSCVKGTWIAVRHHLGSMALAGLILPLCAIPRLISDGIRNYLGMPHTRSRYDQNDHSIGGQFKAMISFFGVALDHTIGGFTPTLYSDMILQSTDFWGAAKDSHDFIHALGGPIALLHGATSVYETVATIINAVICASIALIWFQSYGPFNDPASNQYVDNHVSLTLFALLLALMIGGTYNSLFASVADTLMYVSSWSRQHYSFDVLKKCCPMPLMNLFGEQYMKQCGDQFPKLGPPPDMRLQNLRAFGGDPLAGKFVSNMVSTMAKNVHHTLTRGGQAAQSTSEQSPLLSSTGR